MEKKKENYDICIIYVLNAFYFVYECKCKYNANVNKSHGNNIVVFNEEIKWYFSD